MKRRHHVDAAAMVLVLAFFSFWSAAIASTLSGSAWVATTFLSAAFFLAAVLWLYHGLVAPRRRR